MSNYVESFHDGGGRIKKRTIADLGRLDQLHSGLDTVINGLLEVAGRPALALPPPPPTVAFAPAHALGDVWALTELCNTRGLTGLRRVFNKTRHRIDVEALLRIMVFNRLCDPDFKLGVLRWLETVAVPGVVLPTVTHRHLLRGTDASMDHQGTVPAGLACGP